MPRNKLHGPLKDRIPARMREARRRSGLTQEQLSSKSKVKVETISRIENGHVQPSLMTLERLTRGLGCPMGLILDVEFVGHPSDLDEQEEYLVSFFRRLDDRAKKALVELLRYS